MNKEFTELGREKLASSGLTPEQGKKLGIYETPSAMLLHDSFNALPALVIPYFDVHGDPAKSNPKWPDFYRLRYLAKGNSFVDLATDKSQRYAQPPNTGVCAYFPQLENWAKIAKNTEQGLLITEGELKAAAATLHGFPTIGLGGVWNFMAQREGKFFLPELEAIDWRQRPVWVCFDSDYDENPNICAAIGRLAQELGERGAEVYVLLLPDLLEDGKTGLDDYFLQKTPEEFEDLLDTADYLGLTKALWQMNDEVIYVEDPGLVIVQETGQKIAPSPFKEHSKWATLSFAEKTINKDGAIIIKKEAAAPAWIKWPLRRSATRVTYAPGQPRLTETNEYNQWRGWGCEPVEGNVEPFLDLVDYLFKDAEPGAKQWFLDWLAYPLQNPGVKMFSSVLLWGSVQGTGKSLVGYTIGEIYGKNFKEITDDDLGGGYTAWAENKQFIMGDEITGNDNRQYANALKRLITQRSITINIKYVPQYDLPDCINYYFTSNHPDAFFLEDSDRRNFIMEVPDEPLPLKFYHSYDKWLWQQGGAAALFHFLLNRKFTKNPATKSIFDPSAHAFYTQAKGRMALTSKGELAAWVQELKEDPEHLLRVGQMKHQRDLFTSKELTLIFKGENPDSRISPVGMGRALSAAGFAQAYSGQPLTGKEGRQGRYFIVRNKNYWRHCKDRPKLEKHLSKEPVRI